MRRRRIKVALAAVVASVLLAHTGCEYVDLFQFGANDLSYADHAEPQLLAGYLFNGAVVDITGSTEPEFYLSDDRYYDDSDDPDPSVPEDSARYLPGRNGGSSFYMPGGGIAIALPDVAPRTLSFWTRFPQPSGRVGVAMTEGFDPELDYGEIVDPYEPNLPLAVSSRVWRYNYRSEPITRHSTTASVNRPSTETGSSTSLPRLEFVRESNRHPDWAYHDWHHVAVVLDRADSLVLFVDGRAVEHSQRLYAHDLFASVSHLVVYISEYAEWDDDGLQESAEDELHGIDELLLFENVLTPEQIRGLYEGTLEIS
ncbi:MAG: hypothetical protein ACLFO1_10410, partial [Spirochaetaceae bacterium]